MRIHITKLHRGIRRTPEFEKKGLAQFSVNVGCKCGHDCLYCSTGAVCRMLNVFKECRENPFGSGYAIIDPDIPDRVATDARRIKKRGLIQICTLVDAWAPEAQQYQLGRRCLEAILSEPGWTVRILTKNAAVMKDFDLIEKHKDRVLVGLSLTAPLENEPLASILEPNASSISDRMAALKEAHRLGFRTYGMLCPLLPGIADQPEYLNALVQFAVTCGAEELFVEPVNARGPGLKYCQDALEKAGYPSEAEAIEQIRNRKNWSRYVVNLIQNIQTTVRKYSSIDKLRFLLYPSALQPEDKLEIRKDDAGVIWLTKG
jgi:DNA repair photolyase